MPRGRWPRPPSKARTSRSGSRKPAPRLLGTEVQHTTLRGAPCRAGSAPDRGCWWRPRPGPPRTDPPGQPGSPVRRGAIRAGLPTPAGLQADRGVSGECAVAHEEPRASGASAKPGQSGSRVSPRRAARPVRRLVPASDVSSSRMGLTALRRRPGERIRALRWPSRSRPTSSRRSTASTRN